MVAWKKKCLETKLQLDIMRDYLHTKELYLDFIRWKSRHNKNLSEEKKQVE